MKTMALRQLLRQPKSVKRLTAAGQAIRITDNGKPLWVIHPASGVAGDDRSCREILECEFEALLGERRSEVSAAGLVSDSRVL